MYVGKRDIKALSIECHNTARGCEWKGTIATLEEHAAICRFSLIPCPRRCKDASKELIMRKDLEEHLTKICPHRPDQCQHCGEKGMHSEIQAHTKMCPKKKISCSNCKEPTSQEDMDAHVKMDCRYTEIPCKFARIGCRERRARREMPSHEGDDSLHLHMALNAIVELSGAVADLNAKLQEQGERKSTSLTFSMPEYRGKKDANEIFASPSFYANGYRLAIEVDVNGYRGTYVSIFVSLLRGKYDARLRWPFIGKVRLMLLNQLEDTNHHTISMPVSAHSSESLGHLEFIHHSELVHNSVKNTQYLKDDTLYFRADVEVSNHKPWLQCKMLDSVLAESEAKFTFILSNYKRKKLANKLFTSPFFYTSPNGYKIAVRVYANGNSSGQGTHVSVCAFICNEKYHVRPFFGEVKVALLNQLEDKNHYCKVGRVFPKFITHSALAHDSVKNIQYLKNDALYFRVSVEVADHKPWLQCTL